MADGAGGREPRDWYLAQLKPGGLVRATENLARQGVVSFMPRREVTQRRRGRMERIRRPLFPGYLFVRVPPRTLPWRTVNSTFGVSRLIGFGAAGPAQVPEALMAGLFARVGPGDAFVPAPDLRTGEEVRIVAGPFAGLLARIESIAEPERIHALLDIMGRSVRAEVTPADLERL